MCRGAGFVHPVLPSGAPDFSRVVPCRCRAVELHKEKQSFLERYSNLGYLAHYTFETLRPGGRVGTSAHYTRACEAAHCFADSPKGWLVLIGPVGSGKTHLACAIANSRLSKGESAFYVGAADLLDHLRGAFSPGSEVSYDGLFEQVKNTALLIVDDVHAEGATPWARQRMEQMLNHRYNMKLPTVITTDMAPDEMEPWLKERFLDTEFCSVLNLGEPRGNGINIPDLPEGLRQETFENFDYRRIELSLEEQQNLEMAYNLAVEFASQPEGWLVFAGMNGCGKTHLAAAIANHRLAGGSPVLFLVVADLLDFLRSAFGPESKVSYSKFFEEVKQSPLLILDDFGEQSSTPWARSKLFQLINYRYNARLPMVVTTEQSLDEIEPRISSRFADPRFGTVFNILAPHYNVDGYGRRGDRHA
ncbi:MAG: ATP-binding protein [Chloroflexi bacterium]|nr:ATP-binding protein [Chloroflexota bacterium]